MTCCVIVLFHRNVWVIPFKDKKAITITNAFKIFLKESTHKPNKLWVDKGSEFYNRSMKPFLQNSNIKMHSYNMRENLLLLNDSLKP